MIIYTNERGEIRAVNNSNDPSLIRLEIDDTANPFNGWSEAKICCYRVTVSDNRVVMMTPYVDSKMLDHIDQLGHQSEHAEGSAVENDESIVDLATTVDENSLGIEDVASLADENSQAIEDLAALIDTMEKELVKLKKELNKKEETTNG